jgi:hypothetical protein
VLSPLIYTIFAADIELWTKNAAVFEYADDTCSSVGDASTERAVEKLEVDAKNILDFMHSNYLKTNPDKMGFLVLRREKPKNKNGEAQIIVDGTIITEKIKEKLLGLQINRDLSWKEYISGTGGLCSSLRRRLFMLSRLAHILPQESLIRIADGLLMSKIRYGIAVYGRVRMSQEEPVNKEQKSIQVIINDMLRIICGKKRRDQVPVSSLLQETGLLSFNQLAVQAVLSLAWKIQVMENHPLIHLMPKITSSTNIVTRSQERGNVETPSGGNKIRNSFIYQAAKLWNAAPMEIKEAKTFTSAGRKIKRFAMTFPI